MPLERKSFKQLVATTLAAAALMLLTTAGAQAANSCFMFGNIKVIASGLTLPLKGTCASFNGFYPGRAGFLLAGDICKSSDGTTVIFNTFTQFNGLPDSLVGSWSTATGTGSGKECTSAACNTFSVTVLKCGATITIPKATAGFEAEGPAALLTE